MAKMKVCWLDLQLFAEGAGAAAGAGGGTSAGAGDTAAAAGQQTKGAKNPLANVIYGKQDAASDDNGAEDTRAADANGPDTVFDERREQYEAFRKEYKAELDADMQKIIKGRLKNSQETVDKYTKLQPVLGMLAAKYGVDAEDSEALTKAIEEDDAYYEEEAFEKGMSVEDLKAVKKMERENAALKAQIDAARQQQQIEADVAKWMHEAEEAAKVFPGLDLGVELQNPRFVDLLRNNIDLQTAYFAIHHRELVPQAMKYAAVKTQEQVAQGIRSGARRPTENGLAKSSTAVVKSDVSQLTKEDRQEIIRRVQRGDIIRF